MRSSLASMPATQWSVNERMASRMSVIDCSTACAMAGLNTLSSKWPWLAATLTTVWLPITRVATMVMASDCVGFTLPGMMEDPGSFSGRLSSPSPERGPEARKRTSLAILKRSPARAARLPWKCARAPWLASPSNRLSAVRKGRPVSSATRAAKPSAKPSGAFSPVPTAVPPCASAWTPSSASSMRRRPRRTAAA